MLLYWMYILSHSENCSWSCDKVSEHYQYGRSPADNTVRADKMAFPRVHVCDSGGLYWFVLTAFFLHPSESNGYRSLCCCGHLCGWLSLRLCRGTEGSTAEEETVVGVSGELGHQMASWLISWSTPNSLSPPLGVKRCAAEDLSSGLTPAKSSSDVSTCYLRAWGLIYEWKSLGVQFWTADNGGEWIKQFVTSSLPLTFTGCWPTGLRGALLGGGRTGIDCRYWVIECKLTGR